MQFNIRPLDPATDYPRIVEIRNAIEAEPVTVEIFEENEKKRPPDETRCFVVAIDEREIVIGYAEAWRYPWSEPGHFTLDVGVEPGSRRAGVGAALYCAVQAFAREHGTVLLTGRVRDDCPECLRFAQRFGFEVVYQMFESTLDLAAFDSSRFAGVVEEVEASGIRFFTYADLAGTQEDQYRLYRLNEHEVYGARLPAEPRPFEQFVKDIFPAYWFQPEWQILAADGERWVGLSAVGELGPGRMYNMMTGVIPEYRRRRIALALKLLAIDACRKHGARYIRTNNRSDNQPILRLNQKLGYQPEPGYYYLGCDPNSRRGD
jgi:GNAT superfamily N-acetyltransferase